MELCDQIRLVIATELGVPMESVRSETLWSELKADSLDRVQVVMRLEDNFSLGMTPDSVMMELANSPIGETIKFVEEQIEARRVGQQKS